MATFIALVDYTQQGLQSIQDSPERAKAFIAQAGEAGVTVKEIFWTTGAHDGVLVLEAPDDETVSGVLLTLARQGNVRTRTLRAYDAAGMGSLLQKVR